MRKTAHSAATVLSVLCALCGAVRADGGGAQPASPLYATFTQWRAASEAEKTALAEDFMRIICGNPTMPTDQLVRCIDESSGELVEAALACSAQPLSK